MLIGATDAHAKNYSLLLGAGSRAQLGPLYEVATVLPCGDRALSRFEHLRDAVPAAFDRAARESAVPPSLRERATYLAELVSGHAEKRRLS